MRLGKTEVHRRFCNPLSQGAMLLVCFLVGGACFACTTPVYQYALERWETGRYTLIVAHHGALSPEDEVLVEKIRERPMGVFALKAVAGEVKLPFAQAIKLADDNAPPEMFLYAPEAMDLDEPLWRAPLSEANVRILLASPAREALFRRLTGPDGIVWLVVKAGDAEADAAIVRRLEAVCAPHVDGDAAKRTDQPDANSETPPEALAEAPVVAACRSSVLAVEPDAPEEALLLGLLRAFAPTVHEGKKTPVAIPVFGRGRALKQFPAAELTDATIGEVRAFLTGSCSCQIKDLNPGTDLFIPEDWDAAVPTTRTRPQNDEN